MDDTPAGSMGQASRHLQDIVQRLADRQPATAFEDGAQVVALDELEGDEVEVLVLAVVEDAGDVLVLELGGGARFLMKPANVLGISRHLWRLRLESDAAIEFEVTSLDDRRHATD